MDHVVPRSPQNGECFHDDDLACNTGTSPTAPVATSAAIEGQFDAPPAGTASPASYPSSPPSQQTGSIIGPVTSTPTIYNDNGSSYTLLTTTYPTTALLTTSTTPASSAPPISTALPLVTLSPETPYANADSNSDSGLSKAAVAGLAIGTTFLGALIAFLTAWLLFKRRDRDRGFVRPSGSSAVYLDSSPELGGMLQKTALAEQHVHVDQNPYARGGGGAHTSAFTPPRKPMPPSGDVWAGSGILPPSASEYEVQTKLSALFGAMHTHIDNFYRDAHASVSPSMAADLAPFGRDAVDMALLLQGCARPTSALKHALVAFVLERTAPPDGPCGSGSGSGSSSSGDAGERSLWPADLVQALALHNNPTLHAPTALESGGGLAAALALHRRLTLHLYTTLHPSSPHTSSSALRAAAEHFSLTFFPWLDPSLDDSAREADLADILGRMLQCRMWMHGLQEEWGVEWQERGNGVVVVRPAVLVGGREVSGQSVLAF